MAESCFLAQFSDAPCEGRLRRCHLIPKQLLVREGRTAAISGGMGRIDAGEWARGLPGDDRSWAWACGGIMGNAGHHGMLDASRKLRIPRSALPPGVEEFAAELGLTWWLDREYGPKTGGAA